MDGDEADLSRGANASRGTPTGILRVDSGKTRRTSLDIKLLSKHEPASPQPSVDRLSVTFADDSQRSDRTETSPKSMDKVHFPTGNTDEENSEEEDYSASVTAIMQRRASTRRSKKRSGRRGSSPFSPDILPENENGRRRSSVFTTSSGDTAITMEDSFTPSVTQDQIFENIKLHKEVLGSVKMQPWNMRKKLRLVVQAKAYIKKHEGALQERLAQSHSTKDMLARCNIYLIKKWQHSKREAANLSNWLIPWERRIKEIESHFGSVVASYFIFLRWLFWVNMVIAIVLIAFVAVPEMLMADFKKDPERKAILPEDRYNSTNFLTLWDFEGVFKYSPMFYGWYTNLDLEDKAYRLPLAYFFTGLAVYVYSFVATLRKMAKNSRMSKLSEKEDECIFSWKLFTGWDYMIGNAETAHNRVASIVMSFKEALLEEAEKKRESKSWKLIGSRILVNTGVLGLLFLSAFAVVTVVARSNEKEANSTTWRRNEITVVMSLISLFFPIFFELLGYFEHYHPRKQLRLQLARIMVLNLLNLYSLIFALFGKISNMTHDLQSLKPPNSTRLPSNFTTPLAFINAPTQSTEAFFNNCYTICDQNGLETANLISSALTAWSPTSQENLTQSLEKVINNATRSMPINLANAFKLDLSSFKDKIQEFLDNITDEDKWDRLVTTTEATVRSTTELVEDVAARCKLHCESVNESLKLPLVSGYKRRSRLRSLCWETMFGQELMKLTVMDLVMMVLSTLAIDFLRGLFVRYMNNCWCWDLEKTFPQYGDFKVAENILHLVNNQGMVWMGMFFSPGLVVLNVFKLYVMMYLRSWAVLACNVPHEVIFRASRSNNFYFALLLMMLFLCVLPVGYTIVWLEPSWHCGPFSKYQRIFHIFTKTIKKALPQPFHKILDYIASPGIVIPLLMLLVLIIYYLISLTNALREANNDLKIQLRRERTEERRKMFQIADRRRRSGSGGSGELNQFGKWKKLLQGMPGGKSFEDTPKESLELEDPQQKTAKRVLSRFIFRSIKKRKQSLSDEDRDDATDTEQHESLPDDASFRLRPLKLDSLDDKQFRKLDSLELNETGVEKLKRLESLDFPERKLRKLDGLVRTSTESGDKHVTIKAFKKRKEPVNRVDSVSSNWSENIPVITISKTESSECILEAVDGQIATKRKQKHKLLRKQVSEIGSEDEPDSGSKAMRLLRSTFGGVERGEKITSAVDTNKGAKRIRTADAKKIEQAGENGGDGNDPKIGEGESSNSNRVGRFFQQLLKKRSSDGDQGDRGGVKIDDRNEVSKKNQQKGKLKRESYKETIDGKSLTQTIAGDTKQPSEEKVSKTFRFPMMRKSADKSLKSTKSDTKNSESVEESTKNKNFTTKTGIKERPLIGKLKEKQEDIKRSANDVSNTKTVVSDKRAEEVNQGNENNLSEGDANIEINDLETLNIKADASKVIKVTDAEKTITKSNKEKLNESKEKKCAGISVEKKHLESEDPSLKVVLDKLNEGKETTDDTPQTSKRLKLSIDNIITVVGIPIDKSIFNDSHPTEEIPKDSHTQGILELKPYDLEPSEVQKLCESRSLTQPKKVTAVKSDNHLTDNQVEPIEFEKPLESDVLAMSKQPTPKEFGDLAKTRKVLALPKQVIPIKSEDFAMPKKIKDMKTNEFDVLAMPRGAKPMKSDVFPMPNQMQPIKSDVLATATEGNPIESDIFVMSQGAICNESDVLAISDHINVAESDVSAIPQTNKSMIPKPLKRTESDVLLPPKQVNSMKTDALTLPEELKSIKFDVSMMPEQIQSVEDDFLTITNQEQPVESKMPKHIKSSVLAMPKQIKEVDVSTLPKQLKPVESKALSEVKESDILEITKQLKSAELVMPIQSDALVMPKQPKPAEFEGSLIPQQSDALKLPKPIAMLVPKQSDVFAMPEQEKSLQSEAFLIHKQLITTESDTLMMPQVKSTESNPLVSPEQLKSDAQMMHRQIKSDDPTIPVEFDVSAVRKQMQLIKSNAPMIPKQVTEEEFNVFAMTKQVVPLQSDTLLMSKQPVTKELKSVKTDVFTTPKQVHPVQSDVFMPQQVKTLESDVSLMPKQSDLLTKSEQLEYAESDDLKMPKQVLLSKQVIPMKSDVLLMPEQSTINQLQPDVNPMVSPAVLGIPTQVKSDTFVVLTVPKQLKPVESEIKSCEVLSLDDEGDVSKSDFEQSKLQNGAILKKVAGLGHVDVDIANPPQRRGEVLEKAALEETEITIQSKKGASEASQSKPEELSKLDQDLKTGNDFEDRLLVNDCLDDQPTTEKGGASKENSGETHLRSKLLEEDLISSPQIVLKQLTEDPSVFENLVSKMELEKYSISSSETGIHQQFEDTDVPQNPTTKMGRAEDSHLKQAGGRLDKRKKPPMIEKNSKKGVDLEILDTETNELQESRGLQTARIDKILKAEEVAKDADESTLKKDKEKTKKQTQSDDTTLMVTIDIDEPRITSRGNADPMRTRKTDEEGVIVKTEVKADPEASLMFKVDHDGPRKDEAIDIAKTTKAIAKQAEELLENYSRGEQLNKDLTQAQTSADVKKIDEGSVGTTNEANPRISRSVIAAEDTFGAEKTVFLGVDGEDNRCKLGSVNGRRNLDEFKETTADNLQITQLNRATNSNNIATQKNHHEPPSDHTIAAETPPNKDPFNRCLSPSSEGSGIFCDNTVETEGHVSRKQQHYSTSTAVHQERMGKQSKPKTELTTEIVSTQDGNTKALTVDVKAAANPSRLFKQMENEEERMKQSKPKTIANPEFMPEMVSTQSGNTKALTVEGTEVRAIVNPARLFSPIESEEGRMDKYQVKQSKTIANTELIPEIVGGNTKTLTEVEFLNKAADNPLPLLNLMESEEERRDKCQEKQSKPKRIVGTELLPEIESNQGGNTKAFAVIDPSLESEVKPSVEDSKSPQILNSSVEEGSSPRINREYSSSNPFNSPFNGVKLSVEGRKCKQNLNSPVLLNNEGETSSSRMIQGESSSYPSYTPFNATESEVNLSNSNSVEDLPVLCSKSAQNLNSPVLLYNVEEGMNNEDPSSNPSNAPFNIMKSEVKPSIKGSNSPQSLDSVEDPLVLSSKKAPILLNNDEEGLNPSRSPDGIIPTGPVIVYEHLKPSTAGADGDKRDTASVKERKGKGFYKRNKKMKESKGNKLQKQMSVVVGNVDRISRAIGLYSDAEGMSVKNSRDEIIEKFSEATAEAVNLKLKSSGFKFPKDVKGEHNVGEFTSAKDATSRDEITKLFPENTNPELMDLEREAFKLNATEFTSSLKKEKEENSKTVSRTANIGKEATARDETISKYTVEDVPELMYLKKGTSKLKIGGFSLLTHARGGNNETDFSTPKIVKEPTTSDKPTELFSESSEDTAEVVPELKNLENEAIKLKTSGFPLLKDVRRDNETESSSEYADSAICN